MMGGQGQVGPIPLVSVLNGPQLCRTELSREESVPREWLLSPQKAARDAADLVEFLENESRISPRQGEESSAVLNPLYTAHRTELYTIQAF